MNWKSLRIWVGSVLLFLLGSLGAGLVKAKWVPNLVFLGNYQFDLAALIFYVGLLGSLGLTVATLTRQKKKQQVEQALAEGRADQRLEQQRFLGRLDHELKNPLTTIRLGIANLQENAPPSESDTGSLERIAHQAQRLQTLVEGLRRLAEMEESSLDRANVSLQEILEEAVELTCSESGWQDRTVQLITQKVPWPLSAVCGDRDLLVLAFRNLIENALKFTSADGRVEVRASEDGRNTVVEVADSGRGILPDDLPHIFDELYRGENARDMSGSGLGLALVRRIIELHGGKVEIHSRTEEGTMVRVFLPLADG
ncbi:MAG: HAMP domain-containing sensor histidine kinase [Anaerolineaceae bacterium]